MAYEWMKHIARKHLKPEWKRARNEYIWLHGTDDPILCENGHCCKEAYIYPFEFPGGEMVDLCVDCAAGLFCLGCGSFTGGTEDIFRFGRYECSECHGWLNDAVDTHLREYYGGDDWEDDDYDEWDDEPVYSLPPTELERQAVPAAIDDEIPF